MYGNEKVRVVGYEPRHVIISTKKGGWEFGPIHDVDRLLLNDGEKGLYVNIKELKPIEPQEINLCEILDGCEGIELWSDIFGRCKLERLDGNEDYKIIVLVLNSVSYENKYEQFTKYGRFYDCYPNGKCLLWPSETCRDWSQFKKPIKVKDDDFVVCWVEGAAFEILRYAEIKVLDYEYDYVVRFEQFNPNLSKEELKKLSIV